MHDALPLVISAGGSPGAFDIVRAMGMAGLRTAVASSDPRDIAFYSRWCAERIVLPSMVAAHDSSVIAILKEAASRRKSKPVLYFASDAELSFVCRNRDTLQHLFHFVLPDPDILSQLFNKVQFHSFAKLHDIPTPESIVVQNPDEMRSMFDKVTFPCIVKPAYSQDWVWDTEEQERLFGPYKKALRRFSSRDALEAFCTALPPRASGFLVQSYVDGRDEQIISFHGYCDERGSCLGWFIGKKIRTFPMHTGGSCYIRTINDDELAQKCLGYLERMKFTGAVKIDLKWDDNLHDYIVLEINPRYNLWHLLGAYAGVNIPYIAFRSQTGAPVPAWGPHGQDDRLLYFKQDLRSFVEGYYGTGEWTWKTYLRSLMVRNRYRVFDPSDVMPFMMSVAQFISRNMARLKGKLSHALHTLVISGHPSADDVGQRPGVILQKGSRS